VNLAYGTPFRTRSAIKIRRVFTRESNLIGWSDWEVILTVPESLLGKDDLEMTLIDVAYRYRAQPTESQVRALSSAGAVYGIRHIAFNEKERTLRVGKRGRCEMLVSICAKSWSSPRVGQHAME
jgi:hypothetical protein